MQSVLISIQPKWVEKILSGDKTLEIRKSKPKLDTPFTVYIYCTKGGFNLYGNSEAFLTDYSKITKKTPNIIENHSGLNLLNGKIIGEFTCDEVTHLGNVANSEWKYLLGGIHERKKGLVTQNACLTEKQCIDYGGKYAWHISDLKIYDKPKELNEFYKSCGEKPNCEFCEYHYTESNESVGSYEECCSDIEGCKPLTRPPQSWGYVWE